MQSNFQPAFSKRFETVIRRRTIGAVSQAAKYLLRLEKDEGVTYPECLRILRFTHEDRLAAFQPEQASDDQRRMRDYTTEGYHLIRAELQYLRGKSRRIEPFFKKGSGTPTAEASIDGSVRNNKGSASLVLRSGRRELALAVVEVEVDSPAEAEIHAAILAMTTALALGHTRLRILTDAELLLVLFEGHGKLVHNPLGIKAHLLLEQFSTLELLVVPRLFNHRADAMALSATS